MKKIIMPVGTSIFENALERGVCVEQNYDYFRDKQTPARDFNQEEKRISSIKKSITGSFGDNSKEMSAEIFSIDKIVAELKEDVQVYLLASDTVLSRLACELIQDWFEKNHSQIEIHFNPQQDVISGLQTKDRENFERDGLVNLINRFDSICSRNYTHVLLNITGGFKATIPYLTIFAQINEIHLKYVFEDTDTVIDIPPVPLAINNELFDQYQKEFTLLETEILKQSDYWKFCQDAKSCLQFEPSGEIFFNSLGYALWDKYKQQFFSFYCPDEVWAEIEQQTNINRILSDSFSLEEQRAHHNISESSHKTVFKMYGSPYRIYYFCDQNKIYVYKTFDENHDAHESYIKNKFTDDFKGEIIENAKLRLIKKKPESKTSFKK